MITSARNEQHAFIVGASGNEQPITAIGKTFYNQVSQDSSLGEQMYHTDCSPYGPGSIPGRDSAFQGIIPG